MDNINICKICNQEVKTHKHYWNQHKIREAEYFQKYLPRRDKYDGTIISFKNREFYLNADFNSRDNLRAWLKDTKIEDVKTYLREWFSNRKNKKNLTYALSQVELRSLTIPGIVYLENVFDNYYTFCESLGFKNKYENFSRWSDRIVLNKTRKIFIDSREKNLLSFKTVKTEIKKLDYGDYCFSNADWSGKTFIERKSLVDFIGTLSYNLERFKREIQRSVDDKAYLIVLVEDTIENALDYKSRNRVPIQIEISPEYIFHNVRGIIQTYPNLQFLFVESHSAAEKMVEKLFSLGADIQKFDLQLLLDKHVL